ncbi:MAG: helix-turn-helix domain-containing protein [Nannocystaceae bacterium]|nr:helix-turn-helix domain-containing protein [Nannocystaceae bacterium]
MPTSPDNPPGLNILDPSTWPPVLDVGQVALILGLRPKKVQQLARARRLHGAFRLGRTWRVKSEALQRWLKGETAR